MSRQVMIAGGFDNLRSPHLRFLEEASRLGEVTVWLWPDEMLAALTGQRPKFPLAEREYFLKAVRYVSRVVVSRESLDPNVLPLGEGIRADVWVDGACRANATRQAFATAHGLDYCVLPAAQLAGFPCPPPADSPPGRKKVVVTGCFDWFHSGHVRFFEEVSRYGDLYVVVGHDANIRALKGDGHPLLTQEERRYVAGSIRFVKQALISSGDGWLDADPEIQRLQPDLYVVNEDGDRGGKREYCARHGIEYRVLKRTPAPGLRPRSSTELRGF